MHLNSVLLLLCLCIVNNTFQIRFTRKIKAIGFPYYKILLTLGTCKNSVLFKEEKVWPTVRLNRVMDIYYRSSNSDVKVSQVDIFLIINNTDCVAFSTSGVGYPEFAATMFYATNMGATYYRLTIFTCDYNITVETLEMITNPSFV
ncbi:uncharacterized protein LOC119828731 [Zerene cesonia]|uniref:uncharacterized protein LOC119828731 n=1 Tax=Zerene cesonia TaxID=33412 RepID=UPI0018E52B81|nr:uncharacterized protein LOC119828731 [Zerene cesonia]